MNHFNFRLIGHKQTKVVVGTCCCFVVVSIELSLDSLNLCNEAASSSSIRVDNLVIFRFIRNLKFLRLPTNLEITFHSPFKFSVRFVEFRSITRKTDPP